MKQTPGSDTGAMTSDELAWAKRIPVEYADLGLSEGELVDMIRTLTDEIDRLNTLTEHLGSSTPKATQ